MVEVDGVLCVVKWFDNSGAFLYHSEDPILHAEAIEGCYCKIRGHICEDRNILGENPELME